MRTTSSVYSPFPPTRDTRLFDELFDAWVFAARDATDAFCAWVDAPGDRATAHVVYRAALDREESAAHALMITCRDESRSSAPVP